MLQSSHSTTLRLLQQQGYSLWILHLESRRILQEDAVRLYLTGLSQREVGQRLGVGGKLISAWLPREIKRPRAVAKPAQWKPYAKRLDPAEQKARDARIVAQAKAGVAYETIAQQCGLTKQRVGQIALAGGVRQRFLGRPYQTAKLAQILANAAKLPNEKERLK